MNRLGLHYPSELDPEQKKLYDVVFKYTTTNNPDNNNDSPVTHLPSSSRLIGPFGILLHTPALGHAFCSFGIALLATPMGALTPRGREIAILVVGAHHRAAYELYAHELIGAKAGLSADEIESIVRKVAKPVSFRDEGEDGVVYDIARELVEGKGVLGKGLWERGVAVLGREGVTLLIQYVGFYAYVCTLLRGFDAEVPTKEVVEALEKGEGEK